MPLISHKKRFSFASFGVASAPVLCTGGTPLLAASPDDLGTYTGFNFQSFDGSIDPMGSNTADRIGAIGSGGSCVATQDFALSAGVTYQFNAYFKQNVSDFVALFASDFTTHSATQYFNVNTGAKLTGGASGTDLIFDCSSIVPDRDGWKFARIQMSSIAGGTYKVGVAVVAADGAFTVLGTEEVIVWHLGGEHQDDLALFGRSFDNAAWTKTNSVITPNTTTTYDSLTFTADTIKEDATPSSTHSISQGVVKATSSLPYKFFVKLKPLGSGSFRRAVLVIRSGANGMFAVYDLSTGIVDVAATSFGAGFSAGSAAMFSVANGYFNCFLAANTDTTALVTFEVQLDGGGSGDGFPTNSYSGDGVSGLIIDDARFFQL